MKIKVSLEPNSPLIQPILKSEAFKDLNELDFIFKAGPEALIKPKCLIGRWVPTSQF